MILPLFGNMCCRWLCSSLLLRIFCRCCSCCCLCLLSLCRLPLSRIYICCLPLSRGCLSFCNLVRGRHIVLGCFRVGWQGRQAGVCLSQLPRNGLRLRHRAGGNALLQPVCSSSTANLAAWPLGRHGGSASRSRQPRQPHSLRSAAQWLALPHSRSSSSEGGQARRCRSQNASFNVTSTWAGQRQCTREHCVNEFAGPAMQIEPRHAAAAVAGRSCKQGMHSSCGVRSWAAPT